MQMITDSVGLAALCEQLAEAPFVTVDTEFMRDSTYWPKLCLIQIASSEQDVWIIDPLVEGMDLAPFYALMGNEKVLKVFHAARQDIEIFVHAAGTIPEPLFDTQIAAMVCGFGDSVSYEVLVRRLMERSIDKSSRFTDWQRRPLSKRQLTYAAADVSYLVCVYKKLCQQLATTGRFRWVEEEIGILINPKTYELNPETAWKRLKNRSKSRRALAILMELAAWREREAQKRDLPRARVLKDDAIQELSSQAPRTVQDLESLRALPKGLARGRVAEELLAAVKRGFDRPSEEVPKLAKPTPLPNGTGPVIDLLKVLVKHKSERHGVAQKLLATVDELEQIALDDDADVPALKGWRREIFGAEALDLKHGRLALTARNGHVELVRHDELEREPSGPIPLRSRG